MTSTQTTKINHNFLRVMAALVALALAMSSLLEEARPAKAAFPGDNGKIAFASTRTTGTGVDNPEGDYEIFTMNKDGTGITQLTKNTANDYSPSFSADGSVLVFTSERDGNKEIYLMSSDGRSQFRLTNNTTTEDRPTISPDGRKIAFESYRDGEGEIYVMDADGSDQTNLTNNAVPDYFPD